CTKCCFFAVLVDRIEPQISFTELLQPRLFFAVLGAAQLNLMEGVRPKQAAAAALSAETATVVPMERARDPLGKIFVFSLLPW
ncbi:MAG: hypothetical protein N2578_07210, partial [Bdellovibrionaceae bacterium]|nr:hypothetical protein [Pseudobdellovibrionaceae bacterium]